MEKRRIYGPHCAGCGSFNPLGVRLLDGSTRPYSGGLADCEKRGVSQYPYKQHACSDFKRSKNDSRKTT